MIFRQIDRLLGFVAGCLLFGMMTLTFVDVVMRYFFNRPINGSFEVTETMMAVLIFAGLPLVSRHREHVAIDTFDHHLPHTVRRVIARLIEAVSAAALAGMAWLLVLKANRFVEQNDVTQTLQYPIAPFVYLMAALTLATALVHLVALFSPATVFAEPASDATAGPEGGAL